MRKLIVSMNLSLDGFMAAEDQQMDWHLRCWTCEMGEELCRQLATADTLVLGRITFDVMAAYWPTRLLAGQCRAEDFAYAQMMNSYKKVLFSSSDSRSAWQNTQLMYAPPRQAIQQLKKLPGKNLMVYGSCQLVETLVHTDLVDEYQLWLHPVVLGKGRRLFNAMPGSFALQLTGTRTYSTGVVSLYYQPVHSARSPLG